MLELAGTRSGKLLALYTDRRLPGIGYLWKCLCDCGKYHWVSATHFKNKRVKSCGCVKVKQSGEASFNDLFARYKYRAEIVLKVEFSLTKDVFRRLVSDVCYYCGVPPEQKSRGSNGRKKYNGIFLYNGVDRIDNTKGYDQTNSRTCCGICNKAKRDLTPKEFEKWIKRLTKYQSNLSL